MMGSSAAIVERLRQVEQASGVRILLAVESGSRAWGFPSRDSDYDVRFIYVRTIDDYLSVAPLRDVIEVEAEDPLDIEGWDVRKAAWLVCRSNATVIEWVTSPIRYLDGEAVGELRALADEVVQRGHLAYHYDRMARRALAKLEAGAEVIALKPYCYALRAALAKRWVVGRADLPPMDLPSLLAGLDVNEEVRADAGRLVAAKATGTERDTGVRLRSIDHTITTALQEASPRPPPILPDAAIISRADAAVRRLLRPA